MDIGQIGEIEEHQTEVEVSMGKIIEEDSVMLIIIEKNYRRDNFRNMQNYRGQNFRGGYKRNYTNVNFGRGRSRSRERQYSGNFRRNNRSSSRSRSGSRASTNRDRSKCYKCRKYDQFAHNCPVSQVEKQSEKIQQMHNVNKEQIALKVLATDTYNSLNGIISVDETIVDHLNFRR